MVISAWEVAAVALGIAYLVLAIRQNSWCWAAAIASTAIYVVLMYRASLYMESALQFFYIGMAVYGWWSWTRGGARAQVGPVTAAGSAALVVSTWPARRHAFAITSILALSLLSGWLLRAYTDAALPYLDSVTTWGSIVTTYLVARKILENWIYWFVIDGVSVYLYVSRELYLTAGLFLLYLILVVIGYRAWRRAWLSMSNG